MMEDGNILDAGEPEPDCPLNDISHQVVDGQGPVEHGFEDAIPDMGGFSSDLFNGARHQSNLRDMFKVQTSRKFEAAGGAN